MKACGIPHLAKNERDAPNFLYAALDKTACAPFFKERRMKCAEPTKLNRKSGMWGTRRSFRVVKKGLIEHYGYFVGGKSLGGIAGIAGANRGFVILVGRNFLLQHIR